MKNEVERRYYCDDCGLPVQDPAPKPPQTPFRYTDSVRRPGVDMCRVCFRAFCHELYLEEGVA